MASLIWLPACGTRSNGTAQGSELQRYEFERSRMGCLWRVTFYARDEGQAQRAALAVFQRLRQLDRALSDWDPDSELRRLFAGGPKAGWVEISEELASCLAAAKSWHETTEGAFDPSLGPLTQLWRKARRASRLPDAATIAAARGRCGLDAIELELSAAGGDQAAETSSGQSQTTRQVRARIKREGALFDLGGIAKGWALDDALRVLRAQVITRALVDGGGDVAAADPPPGKIGWRVELSPLGDKPLGTILLRDAAVATSGGRWQTIEIDGQRYAHLLDPKTGLGLRHRVGASVIAKDATRADALATALCILGPERGVKIVKQSQAECAILHERMGKLEVVESDCFRKLLAPGR